jgi:cytochrome b subunit of formate dehydrogenase
MTMVRILSIIALVLLLALIALDLRKQAGGKMHWKKWLQGQWASAGSVWGRRRAPGSGKPLEVLRGLFYLITLVLFLILALTGFVPMILLGEHLTGALLVIHVTAAPLFALSLAVLSLLWAHRQRFTAEDGEVLRSLTRRENVARERSQRFVQKVCFWLILFFSLPLILSIILGVFPLFGTEGQEALVIWHGLSALLLTVAAIVHSYTLTTHSQRRRYYHGEHS